MDTSRLERETPTMSTLRAQTTVQGFQPIFSYLDGTWTVFLLGLKQRQFCQRGDRTPFSPG
jgi:hypothetical protein